MKIALLRHVLRDPNGATWSYLGAIAGVVLGLGTIWAGWRDPELTAVLLGVWWLGWLLGPLLTGGGDQALRPAYFRSLGLSRWQLSRALLIGGCVGIAPAVTLIALGSLLAAGIRGGGAAALVAVPAMVAQLACFVMVSKLAVALYGVLLASRLGAVLAGVVTAFTLAFTAQGWALVIAFVSQNVTETVSGAARAVPSGWGLTAVEAARRGDWGTVAIALAGLVALTAVAYVAWTWLLARGTVSVQLRVRPRRLLTTAVDADAAALGARMRTQSRDLLLTNRFVFALTYALAFCLMPLAIGWAAMLPWVAPIFVIMATMLWSNQYGVDGTSLWMVISAPGAVRVDVRARQRAYLIMVGPLAVVLAAALTPLAHTPAQWPYLVATLPAVLGAGVGLTTYMSVRLPTPTTDPHLRSGNPLNTGADAAEVGPMYLAMGLAALAAAPGLITVVIVGWWGVLVGVVCGLVVWRLLTRLAVRRLEEHGAELLELFRQGRSSAPATVAGLGARPTLTPGEQRRMMAVGGLAAIPLFPQGIVALVFLASGTAVRSWFLAMYVPAPWGWPVALGMIILGASMYGYAVHVYRGAARRQRDAAHQPLESVGATPG